MFSLLRYLAHLKSKGLFTVSISVNVSVSVNALYGYNAVLIGPFTVIPSVSVRVNRWVLHPFPASASASILLNPVQNVDADAEAGNHCE